VVQTKKTRTSAVMRRRGSDRIGGATIANHPNVSREFIGGAFGASRILSISNKKSVKSGWYSHEPQQNKGFPVTESENFSGLLLVAIFFSTLVFVPLGAIVGAIWKGDAKHGACLGFLLGPLGVLAIGLLTDKKTRCIHCRSAITAGATVCRACGREPFSVAKRPAAVMVGAGAGAGGSSRVGGSVATCRRCNVPTLESLELGQSVHTCPQCGSVHV